MASERDGALRPAWRGAAAGRMAVVPLVLVATIAVLAAACTPVPPSSIERRFVEFPPSVIDPQVDFGESARSLAGAPTGNAQGRLVVLFAGSGAGPNSMSRMVNDLVAGGYHVLGVTYESSVQTLTACPDSVRLFNPDCHRAFRAEVAFGQGVPDPTGVALDHPAVQVSAANSAMNGLMKQLEYVRWRYPLQGWEQFLSEVDGTCVATSATYGACEPRWDRITLMGFSQGGGVALYLSKFVSAARVGLVSAPFDVFNPSSSPTVAPWIAEGGFATPPARIASLHHASEPNRWRLQAATSSLGLTGPEVVIGESSPPYGGSNRLVSTHLPACSPVNGDAYHSAAAGGSCSDVALYSGAWRHLANG